MKSTILITGGSGLLALNWALATRDRYAVTLGLHVRKVSLPGVETRRFSLDSVDAILGTLEVIQPHLVIHTAGLTNVEECEVKPDLAQYANVDLAANVAQACARLRLPLVHISTDHLFSGKSLLVEETHLVAPQNAYARTKAEAELRVLEFCPQTLVVRTNFYGWGPSYRRSFSDVIIAALREGDTVTLFQDVFYTPILSEALADAVHQLVDRKARGVFHVAGDELIPKHQFGLKVAAQFQLDPSLIKAGNLADRCDLVHRPRDMSLSNQKASRLLGRKLGGVDEQLQRLLQQEKLGLAREAQNL